MLTFKNITTGISILFGVYSIYNIFEYLRIIERYRLKKTNNFYKDKDTTKYDELQLKYTNLQKKYENLIKEYQKIKGENIILNIKLFKLQDINNSNDLNNIVNDVINDMVNTIINENDIDYHYIEHCKLTSTDLCKNFDFEETKNKNKGFLGFLFNS
jgi:hypothetical protein